MESFRGKQSTPEEDEVVRLARAVRSLSSTSYFDMIRASPPVHRAFVVTAALQCFCILFERVYILSQNARAFEKDADIPLREALWFFIVIAFSAVFVFYFAVHSMLETNTYEMIAFFVSSVVLLARLISEYAGRTDECVGDSASNVCAGFLGVALIFVSAGLVFFFLMYRDLVYKRYKALGSKMYAHKAYLRFELFSAVRKLDFQFSLITLITGVTFFIGAPGPFALPAFIVNILLFGVELVWERAGVTALKSESRWHLALFWALSPLLPAFILILGVETITTGQLFSRAATGSSLRPHILAMGGLALAARTASVVMSILLARSFGPDYVALRRILEGDRKTAFSRATRRDYEKAAKEAAAAAAGKGMGTGTGAGAGRGRGRGGRWMR